VHPISQRQHALDDIVMTVKRHRLVQPAIAITQLAKAGKDAVDPLVDLLEHEQRDKAVMAAAALIGIRKPAVRC
jgi:hypothetical protein